VDVHFVDISDTRDNDRTMMSGCQSRYVVGVCVSVLYVPLELEKRRDDPLPGHRLPKRLWGVIVG
jgi:hypothetical protein